MRKLQGGYEVFVSTELTRSSPSALIIPARSHAEVIITAVAARDRKKAEVYAKRYGIPIVHDSYDSTK